MQEIDELYRIAMQNPEIEVVEKEIPWISFPALQQFSWLRHMFTTRLGGASSEYLGTLNLSYSRGDDPKCVDENFDRVSHALNREQEDFILSDQTHTSNILRVGKAQAGMGLTRERSYHDIDGLTTDEEGVVLGCFFADCVPVCFADSEHHAIGLCHSGWRGTAAEIAGNMVERMEQEYGTRRDNLTVVIGPSICRNCYEVSEDTIEEFKKFAFFDKIISKKENGKYLLDLWETNRQILLSRGLTSKQIHVAGVCTCCHKEILFSHRGMNGKRGNLGAFMTIEHKI